jgi:hypothetical protein
MVLLSAQGKEQASMIRRYIIWRNNHAYDERLPGRSSPASATGRTPPSTGYQTSAHPPPAAHGAASTLTRPPGEPRVA